MNGILQNSADVPWKCFNRARAAGTSELSALSMSQFSVAADLDLEVLGMHYKSLLRLVCFRDKPGHILDL